METRLFFKRKKPDGTYGATWWTYIRGLRVSTGCQDRRAAEIWRRAREREGADPRYAAAQAARLDDAIRSVYDELRRRGRSPATISRAKQKLGHFARLWGSDLKLAAIDAPLISDYIDKRLKAPGVRKGSTVSRTTVRDELAFLRQLLKIARHNRLYPHPIEDVMPIIFEAHNIPVKRWVTPENLPKLLEHVEPHHAAHVAFMVVTGARLAESYRARRTEVTPTAVTLHVSKTAKKTGKETRTVPVSPFMAELLKFVLKHAEGEDLLFRKWGNIQRDLKLACERAKIPQVGPNDLRRSFGKWHRARGFEPSLIAVLLGHTTSKLAETTYATVEGPELADLVLSTYSTGRKKTTKNPGKTRQKQTP